MELNPGTMSDPGATTDVPRYGLRFDPDRDRRVTGTRVWTGRAVGPASLGLWSDLFEVIPDEELERASWTSSTEVRWQGADFAEPVEVSSRSHYWLVWDTPRAAQLSVAQSGRSIEFVVSAQGDTNWSIPSPAPWMLRVYCCVE